MRVTEAECTIQRGWIRQAYGGGVEATRVGAGGAIRSANGLNEEELGGLEVLTDRHGLWTWLQERNELGVVLWCGDGSSKRKIK